MPTLATNSPSSGEAAESFYQNGLQCANANDFYQARIFLEECLRIAPNHFFALTTLASVFLKTNRIREALTYYRQALKIDPRNAAILNELGNCYRAEGSVEKAISHYEKVLKLEPDNAGTLYNLARIRQPLVNSPFVRHLNKLYASPECSNPDRVLLGFALAKIYENHADTQQAFAYYEKANALQFTLSGYNEAAYFSFFDQLETVFTPELFQRLGHAHATAGIRPVFVIGMPRSGTSLVEHILASHSGVYGAGEVVTLSSITEQLISQNPTMPFPHLMQHMQVSTLDQIADIYLKNLSCYCPNESTVIIDKMPNNFFVVGLIRALFPDAPIIHCVRDPMDVCWSLWRQRFDGAAHGYCYDQQALGRYYLRYQCLMRHWHRVLPGALYDIRYEELVENPEKMVRGLLEHCGLGWEDNCLHFYRTKRPVSTASAAQVRRPLYKSSMKAWSPVAGKLTPLQETLRGVSSF